MPSCRWERVAFADPWTRRMYWSDLTDNSLATYRVIRSANNAGVPPILGWGGFWLLVDEAHIATVAAHPEYRGCGLGQWLMVALLDKALERGALRRDTRSPHQQLARGEAVRQAGL